MRGYRRGHFQGMLAVGKSVIKRVKQRPPSYNLHHQG